MTGSERGETDIGSALRPPKALSDRSTLTRSGRVKREVHRARRDWGISVMRRPVKMSEKSAICERVPRREGGQGACPSVSLGDGLVDGASGRAGGAGRGSLNSRSSRGQCLIPLGRVQVAGEPAASSDRSTGEEGGRTRRLLLDSTSLAIASQACTPRVLPPKRTSSTSGSCASWSRYGRTASASSSLSCLPTRL